MCLLEILKNIMNQLGDVIIMKTEDVPNSAYTAIRELGDDSGASGKNNNDHPDDKYLLKMWYYSLIVSLLPMFVMPIFFLLISSKELLPYFITALGSSEIVYMAISLTVISTNDMSNMGTRKKDWLKLNQLLVIAGALLYGIMNAAEYLFPEDYNTRIAVAFNVVFFLATVMLGSAAYLKDC